MFPKMSHQLTLSIPSLGTSHYFYICPLHTAVIVLNVTEMPHHVPSSAITVSRCIMEMIILGDAQDTYRCASWDFTQSMLGFALTLLSKLAWLDIFICQTLDSVGRGLFKLSKYLNEMLTLRKCMLCVCPTWKWYFLKINWLTRGLSIMHNTCNNGQ